MMPPMPTRVRASRRMRSRAEEGACYLQGRKHVFVMPGLGPGIHVLLSLCAKDVDGRDKPGHDGERV